MAEDLGELAIRIAIAGKQQAKSDLKEVGASVQEAGTRAEKAGRQFHEAGGGLAAFGGELREVASGAQEFAESLGLMRGIEGAANLQAIGQQFTFITGSAAQAAQAIGAFKELGPAIGVEPATLAGFARTLLATGENAEQAARSIRAFADAAALSDAPVANIGRLSELFARMRTEPRMMMRAILELPQLGIDPSKVFAAATGERGLTNAQTVSRLESMGPARAAETLLRGIEIQYRGVAESMSSNNIPGLLRQIGVGLSEVFEPTGELLLPVLKNVATAVSTAAGAMKRLNEMTGGGAGLIVGIYGLYRAGGQLLGFLGRAGTAFMTAGQEIRTAGTAIQQLTIAIEELAVAARGAASAGSPGGGGFGIVPVGLGGGRGAPGGFNPDATQSIPQYGGSFSNAFKAGGVSGAAQVAKNKIMGGAGASAEATGLRGLIGNIPPPHVGPGVEQLLYYKLRQYIPSLPDIDPSIRKGMEDAGTLPRSGGAAKKDGTLDELKKQTALLAGIHGHVIGGGARANSGFLQAEMEMARITMTGIG